MKITSSLMLQML